MTGVVAALVVVVVLLSVLVAGLLRSHATILRRLHELGVDHHADPGVPVGDRSVPRTDGRTPSPRTDLPDGRAAVDVSGTGPGGEAIGVRVVDVAHDTVLVFLSSGCSVCTGFWEELADPRLPEGTRLVVVTRGPEEESPSAVRELAPPGVTVIMSTPAWQELGVPGSPFVTLVDGPSGRIVGEGTAASWSQVRDLYLRAEGDAAVGGKAGADRRRERELDRLLLASGLTPGDPSLYAPADRDGADDAGRAGPTR